MAGHATHAASQLTIYLHTYDRAQHHSLLVELVQRARRAQMAGGTVFEAAAGFGSAGSARRHHLVGGSAPLELRIIDDPDRIEGYLAQLGPLLDHVLVTVRAVEVVER